MGLFDEIFRNSIIPFSGGGAPFGGQSPFGGFSGGTGGGWGNGWLGGTFGGNPFQPQGQGPVTSNAFPPGFGQTPFLQPPPMGQSSQRDSGQSPWHGFGLWGSGFPGLPPPPQGSTNMYASGRPEGVIPNSSQVGNVFANGPGAFVPGGLQQRPSLPQARMGLSHGLPFTPGTEVPQAQQSRFSPAPAQQASPRYVGNVGVGGPFGSTYVDQQGNKFPNWPPPPMQGR